VRWAGRTARQQQKAWPWTRRREPHRGWPTKGRPPENPLSLQ
jgi:hypothetical protein